MIKSVTFRRPQVECQNSTASATASWHHIRPAQGISMVDMNRQG